MTADRALRFTVLAHLALLPVLLLLAWLDPRQLMGANLWWKPVKFFISVIIYVATVRYLLRWTTGPALQWIGYGIALTMIGENVFIAMQAARGVRSHFNADSPADALVFSVMGVMILLNTLLLAWLFLWHCMHRIPTGAGLRWGIRWGLATALVASAIGGVMVSHSAHTIGVPDGGPGTPFLNWSRVAGDVRIAHFIGLHGLQALPLAGYLVDRSSSPRPWLLVAVAALSYLGFVTVLLLQALSGKPLFT